MRHHYQRERAVAVTAAREAARLCRAVQGDLQADALEKADRSPVTVADFGSQALVCRALKEAFPGDPVVAEEDAALLRVPENEALLRQVLRRVEAVQSNVTEEALVRWIDHGNAESGGARFWTLDPIDAVTPPSPRPKSSAISGVIAMIGTDRRAIAATTG